ncbi:HAD-IA family hydrolase [Pseudoroseicyclus tamaricis]|uniref:HAD-IA family hydrolase n=1 Tax=Pseudoroseicyclus tamaricis TaxID=2705421 RepID=A0A6B2JW41_9RHOB|nr:HAD-IA family hydrolase [Pseudoroseicyclus tamaricis]NDV00434.1 HAD-IA family hydrolase [Pseudoroseicyclus tamaricis]
MSLQLMLDVDGVLVTGRPGDGRPWATSLAADLGLEPERLQESFFRPHWQEIVTGRAELEPALAGSLAKIAPDLPARDLMDYWFSRDSRIDAALLDEVASLRAGGLPVWLATNQEHRRAAYLLETLGLAAHVDGILHSARLGAMKPEPAFFAAAEAAAGGEGPFLLVDDSERNVTAARAAGWQAEVWTGEARLADLVAAARAR